MIQKKYRLSAACDGWLRDLCKESGLSESDVLRDLIRDAHVALLRGGCLRHSPVMGRNVVTRGKVERRQ